MFWDTIRITDLWWNFEKFIIDRDGHPLYRVNPSVWDHGNTIKPLLEEAFGNKTTGVFSNNVFNYNVSPNLISNSSNGVNSLRPLSVLG